MADTPAAKPAAEEPEAALRPAFRPAFHGAAHGAGAGGSILLLDLPPACPATKPVSDKSGQR